MPHISSKEILTDARRRSYGVGNMLGSDIEMVVGFCRAAEEMRSPVLLCFNQEVNPKVPMEIGIPLIVNAAEKCKAPVATVLDHGHSLAEAIKAIELGINTVMFDGSLLPYEENVTKTKEVVDYAHARGVSVEGELGCITGSAAEAQSSSSKAIYTDPDQASDFTSRTGVDFLAISFGNSHGLYKGKPILDLERVRKIFQKIEIPIVMHGGSGLEFEIYPEIISAGISKINYYSALSEKAVGDINFCMQTGDKTGYHNMVDCAEDSFYNQMKHLMRLWKSVTAAATIDETIEVLTREVIEELLNDGNLSKTKRS